MYITEIAACAAAVISLYSIWSNKTDKRFDELKADMKEGFSKVDRRFERMEDQIEGIYFCIFIWIVIIIYIFRHKPICGLLWKGISFFGVILLIVLGANYAKKEVKKWWKED